MGITTKINKLLGSDTPIIYFIAGIVKRMN